MWNTDKLGIRTPSEWEDPFWTSDENRMIDLDDWIFSNTEDKNLFVIGEISFNETTGEVSWGAPIYLASLAGVGVASIPADSIILQDGQFGYVVVPRPIVSTTLIASAGSPPIVDQDIVPIFIRRGNNVYVRGQGTITNVPLHGTTHSNNGGDEINVTGLSGLLADPQTPKLHNSTHESGGADEIDVTDLNGLLADPQTPIYHGATHEAGQPDEISVAGLSGVLSDPQNANKLLGTEVSNATIADAALGYVLGVSGNTPNTFAVVENKFSNMRPDTIANLNSIISDADLLIDSMLNVPNGVAGVDSGGHIPISLIPDSLLSGSTYQGTWDASANLPLIQNGVGTNGHYYRVSIAGSTEIDGISDWKIGDWIIFDGTVWGKVDNTESVTAVFGRVGSIIAMTGDYDASQITNAFDVLNNNTDDILPSLTVSEPGSTLTAILNSLSSKISGTPAQYEFYVSPTGDDTTGDGLTPGTAFATVEKCIENLPYSLPRETSVVIKMANGTYTSFPESLSHHVPSGSQFVIDGYEGMVDHLAGPYTVNTFSTIAGFCGQKINLSTSPFTANSLHQLKCYIHVLSGAMAGYEFPIFQNGTNFVVINNSTTGLSIGDTFKIVKPGVEINIAGQVSFAFSSSHEFSCFSMSNIKLTSSFPYASPACFMFTNEFDACLFGVVFVSTADASGSTTMCGTLTSINAACPADYTKITYCNNLASNPPWGDPTYFNYAAYFSLIRGTITTSSCLIVKPGSGGAQGGYGSTRIERLCTRGKVLNYAMFAEMVYCGMGQYEQSSQQLANGWMTTCMIETTNSSGALIVKDNSKLFIGVLELLHTVAKTQTILMDKGSQIEGMDSITAAVSDQRILTLGFGCKVMAEDVPPVTGSVCDIYFARNNIARNWPSPGASVSDGEDAFVAIEGSVPSVGNGHKDVAFVMKGSFVIPSGAGTDTTSFYTMPITKASTPTYPQEALLYKARLAAFPSGESQRHLESVHSGIAFRNGGPYDENVDTIELDKISESPRFVENSLTVKVVSAGSNPIYAGMLRVDISWETTALHTTGWTINYALTVEGDILQGAALYS